LHFLPLIEQLLDGNLKLSDLSETPEVSTAITRQFVENQIKQIKHHFYLNTARGIRYLEHSKNVEQVTNKNAEQLSLFDIQQYTQETPSIDIRQYTQKTSSIFIPKPVQILTLP
jgi:hypothetical protein